MSNDNAGRYEAMLRLVNAMVDDGVTLALEVTLGGEKRVVRMFNRDDVYAVSVDDEHDTGGEHDFRDGCDDLLSTLLELRVAAALLAEVTG